METVAYFLIAVFALMIVLFMLGAAKLAAQADQQSEAIGRAVKRMSRERETQDSVIGTAAGPRNVNPV